VVNFQRKDVTSLLLYLPHSRQ